MPRNPGGFGADVAATDGGTSGVGGSQISAVSHSNVSWTCRVALRLSLPGPFSRRFLQQCPSRIVGADHAGYVPVPISTSRPLSKSKCYS